MELVQWDLVFMLESRSFHWSPLAIDSLDCSLNSVIYGSIMNFNEHQDLRDEWKMEK